MTDVYIQLGHDDYKELEEQLLHYKKMETTHTSVEGYYHKAFRLKVGTLLFEFQGPAVKQPKYDEDPVCEHPPMFRTMQAGTHREFCGLCKEEMVLMIDDRPLTPSEQGLV